MTTSLDINVPEHVKYLRIEYIKDPTPDGGTVDYIEYRTGPDRCLIHVWDTRSLHIMETNEIWQADIDDGFVTEDGKTIYK